VFQCQLPVFFPIVFFLRTVVYWEEEEEEEEEDEEDEEDEAGGRESSDEDALDGPAPTPKRRKFAQAKASLGSGLYPTFQGLHGLAQDLAPNDNNAFEYLVLLWPESLCELIALIGMQTKRRSANGKELVLQRCGILWVL
jgi:hypothetical protein